MITEDFKIAEDIFSLINDGVVNGYDSFRFTAEVYEGYMETELSVISDGVETDNPQTNFNGAILYDLVKKLKANFVGRGENWKSFTMSHVQGGQVKTHFEYPGE